MIEFVEQLIQQYAFVASSYSMPIDFIPNVIFILQILVSWLDI